ncbi:MAG: ribbon-helix-helix protein, CopG family [Ruminococcus sp.]|nr:ribbon-helix-helix protein, CopG family [Ruminococcus sp.]
MSELVKKRKTKTSTAVKSRYNQKVYDVISVRVPKDLSKAFREKCIKENVSQASVLKNAIETFLKS